MNFDPTVEGSNISPIFIEENKQYPLNRPIRKKNKKNIRKQGNLFVCQRINMGISLLDTLLNYRKEVSFRDFQ